LAILLIAVATAPALADVRIVSSSGGVVGNYLEFFSRVRRSGDWCAPSRISHSRACCSAT